MPSQNTSPFSPSRINSPGGQSSMSYPSPSSLARQPPGGSASLQVNLESEDLLMVSPQVLAILRQELNLGVREPNQMTPAERQRLLVAYRQRRARMDGSGPTARSQPPNPAQILRLPGIPMPGQNPLMTMGGPPQLGEPITSGVLQGGQPHMGTPVNMGFGQPPLSGPQLGVSLYPQGHANLPGLMDQQAQQLEYQMQNLQLNGRQSQTPATNGVLSSSSTPSPPPMENQRSVISDNLFPPDFMQWHISNSLDDFNTNIFSAETDINFERDFGQWFNGDDVPLDMQ